MAFFYDTSTALLWMAHRCGAADGGWLTTWASTLKDTLPGATAGKSVSLTLACYAGNTNKSFLLLQGSSPPKPISRVAWRSLLEPNNSNNPSQGLGCLPCCVCQRVSHPCQSNPFCLPIARLLRNYPPAFGKRISKIFDRLCSTRVLREADADINAMDSQQLFFLLEWGDLWEDANMVSVLTWLRGNKHLNLGTWREMFPTTI